MHTTIPALTIEENDDGTLMLEQDWCGQVDRIAIHPIHVRHLAERLGLIRAPGAEWNQIPPARTLARRLLVLFDRINQLDDWLNAAAQRGHEDLEAETIYSFATWELANEFVSDLPADGICHTRAMADASHEGGTAAAIPPKTGALNTTENGGIESPQKRGPSLFE